jgi:hypothetical protein
MISTKKETQETNPLALPSLEKKSVVQKNSTNPSETNQLQLPQTTLNKGIKTSSVTRIVSKDTGSNLLNKGYAHSRNLSISPKPSPLIQQQKIDNEALKQKPEEKEENLPSPPLKQLQEEVSLTIHGEVFLNKSPPRIELSGQIYSKVDTGLGFGTHRSVITPNLLCGHCMSKDEGSHDIMIHSTCRHWSHLNCIKKKQNDSYVCPICRPVNRPIDNGQSEFYTNNLELLNGRVGYTTPINSAYKQTKMSKIMEKIGPDRRLNFEGDIEAFMINVDVCIDDYFCSGKNVLDLQRLTGVTTVFELEKKGLGFRHICNKSFMLNTDIMKSFGIDRHYIRSKFKTWPLPQIKVKGKDLLMNVHPLEYMDRKGFSKEDFIALGWNNKGSFVTDGTNKELADYVFR